VHRWLAAISAGALAAIAIASLLVHQPFTLAIARRETPRELWDHPEFVRINTLISSVWAGAFAATAIASALLIGYVKNDTAPLIVANAVFVAGAFAFTNRTVRHARARARSVGLM
jgi:hypothetical protein